MLFFTELRLEYWDHDFTQAEFNRRLIRERKIFASELVDIHNILAGRRRVADYGLSRTSEAVARRGVAKAETFVQAVQTKIEEKP